jgi:hypothetical protein
MINLSYAALALDAAWRFSELAARRARAISHNTLRQLRNRELDEAVLITGGFLTEYILREFTAQRISHVVIIPRSTSSSTSFDDYVNSFLTGG